MSRAAKQVALRILAGENESDDNSDIDGVSDIDDIHEDVDLPPANEDDNEDTDESGNSEDNSANNSDDDDGNVLNGRDNTQWQVIDEYVAVPGRAMRADVLRPAPGLTAYAHQRLRDNPILDSFQIFFSNDMINTIVIETNRQGRRVHGNNYKEIDITEMQAFIGLLILRGVYRSAGESTDELWSSLHGRAIFSKTMSLNRFKLIRGILRFDNVETRQARLMRDKLAAIRLLLDGFVDHSQRAYIPGASITVDEQLYPYRGRCRYRQYMPSKPAKYGLKFWLASDSDNHYCCNIQFYCGRDDEREADIPLGEHIVLSLTDYLRQSGRNVTCDNFFTSLTLA